MPQKYLCNNRCLGDTVLTGRDVVDIIPEKQFDRFLPGDIFTDKECSRCGALALPERPEQPPAVPDMSIDYTKLAKKIALLDYIRHDMRVIRRPDDVILLDELIEHCEEVRDRKPFAPAP